MPAQTILNFKLGINRCYLLKCTDGYLLIDTYYPKSYSRFEKKLSNLGILPTEIKYLLLTHHHDDHAGFAAELVEKTGCKVIAHRNAILPLQRGRAEDTARGLNISIRFGLKIAEILNKKYEYPPLKLTETDIKIDGDNDSLLREIGIDGMILHTPGHTNTRDSISVLLKDGQAFVGDAAMNIFKWAGTRHRPIMIGELETVYSSWLKLKRAGAKMIYPTHGKPFSASRLRFLSCCET